MLFLAIDWWLHALKLPLKRSVSLSSRVVPVVELFCDARGSPPRVVAVLIDQHKKIRYTDWQPWRSALAAFASRKDDQIMGLELMSILIGLCTFAPLLAGTTVRVWSDNTGGENALRAGSAKCEDHNLIIHAIWLMCAKCGCGAWVERVGSHDNISDDPSREEYGLLTQHGATWHKPRIPKGIDRPRRWASWDFQFFR